MSHFCEKVRWALERSGIPFREERHLPVFHLPAVRRAGGKRKVPVLVADGEVVEDSSAILDWIDRQRPELMLYPAAPEQRSAARALEDLFDETLAPATRRMAYFYLLSEGKLARRPQPGVPRIERWLWPVIFPAAVKLLRRAMHIDAAAMVGDREKVDHVFGRVEQRLADGRPFLMGDHFTAVDLTFAALAAPLLLPEHYGARLPTLEAIPASYRALVTDLRGRPAGAFGLRLYEQERRRLC